MKEGSAIWIDRQIDRQISLLTTSKNITYNGYINKFGPKYKKLQSVMNLYNYYIYLFKIFFTHMLYIIALKMKIKFCSKYF